jgi:hypothetical protein
LEIEMMRRTIAIAALCAGVLCGCGPIPRTGPSAQSTIRRVFQTELPASATNAVVRSASLMTLVVHGRFECDRSALPDFLTGSALLPDELKAGANPLRRIQQPNLPWWQPASLQDASGIECDWDAGSSVASCSLATGTEPDVAGSVVYFMVVYENKNQTGLRPEVKADPDWGQQTNGISNKTPVPVPQEAAPSASSSVR